MGCSAASEADVGVSRACQPLFPPSSLRPRPQPLFSTLALTLCYVACKETCVDFFPVVWRGRALRPRAYEEMHKILAPDLFARSSRSERKMNAASLKFRAFVWAVGLDRVHLVCPGHLGVQARATTMLVHSTPSRSGSNLLFSSSLSPSCCLPFRVHWRFMH